jgi:hypothetical protein
MSAAPVVTGSPSTETPSHDEYVPSRRSLRAVTTLFAYPNPVLPTNPAAPENTSTQSVLPG